MCFACVSCECECVFVCIGVLMKFRKRVEAEAGSRDGSPSTVDREQDQVISAKITKLEAQCSALTSLLRDALLENQKLMSCLQQVPLLMD